MRRSLLLLLAAAALLVATGCLNGRYPDSTLTTISPECRILNSLAPGLTNLLKDANDTPGVELAPEKTDPPWDTIVPKPEESCYRSIEGQRWWRDFYCFFGKCGFAAVPGTSRHGLGRAVDFEGAGGKELTFSDPGYQWLVQNAAKYGFHHPAWAEPGGSSPEPWHWEG
jgi:hypothetical protein